MSRQKTLSDEHKKHIGESVKMRWKRGDFDSKRIRKLWSNAGKKKKGTPSPIKFVPSQEMMDDYSKMGDKDLCAKYNISRGVIIRVRKEYDLPRFNNQHGTVEHTILDEVEYKYCQYKEHWEPVSNFGKNRSRWDGLRGWCKECEREKNHEYYDKNGGNARTRRWLQTESGRSSRAATMRKVWEKRRGCYVKFDLKDEKKVYDMFNGCCAYCEMNVEFSKIEFDHFIPVKLGGKTHPSNMLPACRDCNSNKRAKQPYEWIIKKFGPVYGEKIYNRCISVLESIGE